MTETTRDQRPETTATTSQQTKTARIRELVERANRHASAWDRGVAATARDLLDSLEEAEIGGYADLSSPATLKRALLNGASSWHEYSYGGMLLCTDHEIAERYCTPSELKKTRNGQRRPNGSESWLDVQARALYQAAAIISTAWRCLPENRKQV